MDALTSFVQFVSLHPYFSTGLLIIVAIAIWYLSHQIGATLNQEEQTRLQAEYDALREKEDELEERALALDKKAAALTNRIEELRMQAWDPKNTPNANTLPFSFSQELEKIKADVHVYKSGLKQRFEAKVEILEQEYAQIYLEGGKIRQFQAHLPDMYAPLFADSMPLDFAKRVLSAASDHMEIARGPDCQAEVLSGSGHIYRTSLISCNCPDFRNRGGPCKHMLFLLFTLRSPDFSSLSLHQLEQLQQLDAKYKRQEQSRVASVIKLSEQLKEKDEEIDDLQNKLNEHTSGLQTMLSSNLTAIPWLAGMMADYLTYDLEIMAKELDWGCDQKRLKKVASIREIRAEAKARIQEAKEAVYQLEYLRSLYPGIDDVLETDYKDLDFAGTIPEHDPARDFLSKEEWAALTPSQRDQLALDRYIQSRSKSKWQIGRDYELSVAHEFIQDGYSVDTFGSYMKLEDLGRDLIARNERDTYIIQCKYWSSSKTIHEKHIYQLYGTLVTYRIENPDFLTTVKGLFVTNTTLSPTAKEAADMLGITVRENHQMTDFPRIKCNIGRDELGPTYIYHLPMDAQYDVVQIKNPGEFYAHTVQEAIDAGFRRAFKWHGN